MISKTTKRFRAAFQALPKPIQKQAREAYRLFRDNPYHPSLQFKKVSTREPIFSVRVGIHYRAVAVRNGEALLWFWIGSHADYDELIARF